MVKTQEAARERVFLKLYGESAWPDMLKEPNTEDCPDHIHTAHTEKRVWNVGFDAGWDAGREPLIKALRELVDAVEMIRGEVDTMLRNKDYSTASEFYQRENADNHSQSITAFMATYADYVLDQTLGSWRWINSIQTTQNALKAAKAALEEK